MLDSKMLAMNTSTDCTKMPPKCLTRAPIAYRLYNVTQSLCNDGGEVVRSWYYLYESCEVDRIDLFQENQVSHCLCIENLLRHCRSTSNHSSCKVFFYSLVSVQLVAIVLGLILNLTITFSFCKKPALRQKLPNILLLNQALADNFNCGIYGISNMIELLFQLNDVRQPINFDVRYAFLPLTLFSSLCLYLIIALERFLSTHNPLWHRVNVRKKHIWVSVTTAWLLSIFITTMYIICSLCTTVFFMIFILLSITVAMITLLFIITFIKAFRAVSNRPSNSTQLSIVSKKQFQSTIVSFIMFLAFAVVYSPLIVLLIYSIRDEITLTLLMLTSILNPLLTLYFKKEFRLRNAPSQVNVARVNKELYQVAELEKNESSKR